MFLKELQSAKIMKKLYSLLEKVVDSAVDTARETYSLGRNMYKCYQFHKDNRTVRHPNDIQPPPNAPRDLNCTSDITAQLMNEDYDFKRSKQEHGVN